MKKVMFFVVGTVCCLGLAGCVGPIPEPYSAYTGAGVACYPGPVHALRALGVTGTSVLENIFHHGRYYHPQVDTPYIYRAPVSYPLPGPYIYR